MYHILAALLLLWVQTGGGFPFKDYSFAELEIFAKSLNGPFALTTPASVLLGTNVATSGESKCSPSIVRVTHRESLLGDVQRPQLLLSGEIHGDERVGPSSTIWAASLLVRAASCEISRHQPSCEFLDKQMGVVSSDQRVWLAFLATRRDTVVIATANCLGYLQDQREDAGVDPNRDFGYSRSNDNCLRSTTARIMNALLARTLMQIVVTFHGGMVAIGYEWGSPNHPSPKDKSPDDAANAALAGGMKQVGGSVPGEGPYPVGRINSLVYPVEGGMEDWMYAAGWDRGAAQLKNCTRYSNTATPPSNRALVFLVETSDKKRPSDRELGGSERILDDRSASNGHVPRNVRLALMTVDVVQPYVCVLSASVADNSPRVGIKWHVGGSASVDATWLAWHPVTRTETQLADHGGDHSYLLDLLQVPSPLPSDDTSRTLLRTTSNATASTGGGPLLKPLAASATQRRAGFWKEGQLQRLYDPFSVTFSAEADAHGLLPGVYWLVAWAQVDGNWGAKDQGSPEQMTPQSLFVNARSNLDWRSEAEGDLGEGKAKGTRTGRRQVRGRKSWPSEPVLVQVTKDGLARVLAATANCAWWARNTTSAALAANAPVRAPAPTAESVEEESKGRDKDDLPVQLVSPGERLDAVVQKDSAELSLDRQDLADSGLSPHSYGIIVAALVACFAAATLYLSSRISALRTRASLVLSVNSAAQQV